MPLKILPSGVSGVEGSLSSEVRTIKNKQILQETILQTIQHGAPSPPAVISDTIMNNPTITNTVASNSIHECPTTTIDLQVDRGNVIHNHTGGASLWFSASTIYGNH